MNILRTASLGSNVTGSYEKNRVSLKILIYIDIDVLYRNCLEIFPSGGQEWINKERENWRTSIHLQNFHLFE